MRGRSSMLILLAMVAAAALAAAPTAVSKGPAVHAPIRVKLVLPAAGKSRVALIVVHAKARPGKKLGALRLRPQGDKQLPSGIRAMAVVKPARATGRTATYQVWVAINNLGHSSGRTAQVPELSFAIEIAHIPDQALVRNLSLFSGALKYQQATCDEIADVGASIEDAAASNETLLPLRGHIIQPSDPEEVFDYVAFNDCPNDAEEPEPGSG